MSGTWLTLGLPGAWQSVGHMLSVQEALVESGAFAEGRETGALLQRVEMSNVALVVVWVSGAE